MAVVFGLPLWVTEVSTADESLQADYLENVYALARDAYPDHVSVVLWFCWSDGMVPPFGVVFSDGYPKPAYYRYRTITPPWVDAALFIDGFDFGDTSAWSNTFP